MEITYKSGHFAALWQPALSGIYLFCGEEDRLKQEALQALKTHVVEPDFQDFDLEELNASVGADAILAASGQAPFGSERRMVVVKGMEQWRDRSKQSEAERLAEGIARLGDTACLALIVAAEEDEARRKTGITVKLDNAVKKQGVLVWCRALSGEGLAEWIVGRVHVEGKRIEGEAVSLLMETVGHEMRPLEQEILKLVCYVGERAAITVRDVGQVVASSPEDVMFTAIEAISRRQTDRALTLLTELHRYDPKPQAVAGKLLALLARQYRMLWQAKFLAEKRVNPREVRNLPPDLAGELPSEGHISQLAFKAGDLFAQSRNYTWTDLSHALDCLLLCDLANKGGATDETGIFGSDPVGNLQLLVLDLTGAYRSQRRA
ncbi:MAG TPA: DNA polymerase III subunit delta [Chthonomonadaceae bacterium]|nr:DNA polymerase III subunit delta [Chthonomonadaceae bacterium]